MELVEIRNLFIGSDEEFQELLKKFNQGEGDITVEQLKKFQEVVVEPLKKLRYGLIVVDYQNDFISGSLAIGNGPANQNPLDALPLINQLVVNEKWSALLYSKDWHPENHISFVERVADPDRELTDLYRGAADAFQLVKFSTPDVAQKLFPSHCVQNSWGADLHKDLVVPPHARFIYKGTEKFRESYSSFGEDDEPSEAADILQEHKIDAVFCLGLAYEICVSATLFSAANRGFFGAMVTDASKGLSFEDMAETDEKLKQKKVALLSTEQVLEVIQGNKIPISWALRILS